MGELLLQKRFHKNNFNRIDISQKTHYIDTTEEKYGKNRTLELVLNIAITNWRMVSPDNLIRYINF